MLYIVRHGQSFANIENIWGGNYKLTLDGKKQALSIVDKLPQNPKVIISSPLIRAYQTARICYPTQDIEINNDFSEIYFGFMENEKIINDDFHKCYKYSISTLKDFDLCDNVEERARKCIEIIKKYEYEDYDTVIFAHHTLMCVILCLYYKRSINDFYIYKDFMKNCAIMKFDTPDIYINNNLIPVDLLSDNKVILKETEYNNLYKNYKKLFD